MKGRGRDRLHGQADFELTQHIGCKHKGLRVAIGVGSKIGEGLMRRLNVSKNPVAMLNAALQEAVKPASVELEVTGAEIFITA